MFATATNQTSGFMPDEDKYTVECLRIEEAPDNGFGVGVRWVLALYKDNERVLMNDGTPMEFWQTTSPNMGPKARARAYVEAFLGRPLEEGERINPNDLPGKWLAGMVIHEDSTTKKDQKVAKLVSVKPYSNGAAPRASAPQRPAPGQVSADASDDEIDRALIVAKIQKSVKRLKILDEESGAQAQAAVDASDLDEALLDDLNALADQIAAAVKKAMED